MTNTRPDTQHNALVIGGGIGGLTAALCLHQAGYRPLVLERATSLGEVGAGIQLSPNACRVLAAIGVLPAIEAGSFAPQSLEMRIGTSGRSVFTIEAGDAARAHWGAPYLHVHRADLIKHLSDALASRVTNPVIAGSDVESIRLHDQHVAVRMADGRELNAEYVIGADGIHSTIRRSLFGDDAARFTGNSAWRATVDIDRLGDDAPPPTACVWVGEGRHAVTYRLRGGRLANIVAVVEQSEWRSESWTERGDKALALADFDGWHPIVTTLLAEADAHYRWALFDRPPLTLWQQGRVALLGDACHAMLPFLAQGAAMAIEDAWVLTATLAGNMQRTGSESGHEPFDGYTAARLARVQRVYNGAKRNMHTFHLPAGLRQTLTYGTMRLGGRLAPRIARAQLDWLYGEDVTARFPIG